MSALAVMCYPSIFHAAFVGAPVCAWEDYDTNYTERVLGLPLEKQVDYDLSSVLTYAKDLLRPLLLVHGTTDDNVYVMHAIKMSAELFKHGREHIFLPLAGTHMLADPMGE
jgi:dipeptidyl-peptidase-4